VAGTRGSNWPRVSIWATDRLRSPLTSMSTERALTRSARPIVRARWGSWSLATPGKLSATGGGRELDHVRALGRCRAGLVEADVPVGADADDGQVEAAAEIQQLVEGARVAVRREGANRR
jgi:hypothetical protein